MKNGSGTVRSVNHNAPPVSRLGTGRAAIPRMSLSMPIAMGTLIMGTKARHACTPAAFCICLVSFRATIISAWFDVTMAASCIRRMASANRGFLRSSCSLCECSAAVSDGLKIAARMMTATAAMDAHHGRPV